MYAEFKTLLWVLFCSKKNNFTFSRCKVSYYELYGTHFTSMINTACLVSWRGHSTLGGLVLDFLVGSKFERTTLIFTNVFTLLHTDFIKPFKMLKTLLSFSTLYFWICHLITMQNRSALQRLVSNFTNPFLYLFEALRVTLFSIGSKSYVCC